MMLRNPAGHWYRLGGGATLDARAVGLSDHGNPSFLARRQQHLNASITTRVRFTPAHDGDRAGLAAFQNDDYWFFLGIEQEIGRAHVCTPVTNAHLVCRLLLEKKTPNIRHIFETSLPNTYIQIQYR